MSSKRTLIVWPCWFMSNYDKKKPVTLCARGTSRSLEESFRRWTIHNWTEKHGIEIVKRLWHHNCRTLCRIMCRKGLSFTPLPSLVFPRQKKCLWLWKIPTWVRDRHKFLKDPVLQLWAWSGVYSPVPLWDPRGPSAHSPVPVWNPPGPSIHSSVPVWNPPGPFLHSPLQHGMFTTNRILSSILPLHSIR